jgi:hypothetical protein
MSNMIYVPGEVLTVVVENQPYTVQSSHPNFGACVVAAKEGRFEDIPTLVNIARSVAVFSEGKIEVDEQNGLVLYNGDELHNYACSRLIDMMYEGFNVEPMVNFLQNLLQNPSKRAIDELYKFLEVGKMPITPDGCFLAYKRVNDNYTSVHDGKTKNDIGLVVEMPRNAVDDNSNRTCSYGLHFCSHAYLSHFSGARVVILKINPRDVVSIPADYNDTKGRACRYEVVGELTPEEVQKALDGGVWTTSVVADYEDRDSDIDGDEIGDEVEQLTPRSEYDQGYIDGYRDGRGKNDRQVLEDDVVGEYDRGYTDGYKDGRGHKPKAVK